ERHRCAARSTARGVRLGNGRVAADACRSSAGRRGHRALLQAAARGGCRESTGRRSRTVTPCRVEGRNGFSKVGAAEYPPNMSMVGGGRGGRVSGGDFEKQREINAQAPDIDRLGPR